MARMLRSTSSVVVAQLETLIRIAWRPCQSVEPHQLIKDLMACFAQFQGEALRMIATAIDELGDAGAPH